MDDPQSNAIIEAENDLIAERLRRLSKGGIAIEECDSPIEDDFLWEYNKVANPRVEVTRQVEIETSMGIFRPDFVIKGPGPTMKIAVECDGKEFHDSRRDAARDLAIVQTGTVRRVYRLRGKDIYWHIYELLEMLGICEPWILSERGRRNLGARTLPISRREECYDSGGLFFPHGAWRRYLKVGENEEEDEDDEDLYPYRPIVLEWTQQSANRS